MGPWMGVGLGFSTSDSVELNDGSNGSFTEEGGDVATVSLEAFYTTLRFDVGGALQHMTGGAYQRPNGVTGRFGAMFSAGPFVRWRYWSVVPGSFYLQYMPAWTAVVHSDYVRRDAAMMQSVDAEDVAEVTHSFSNNVGAGFILMLRPDIALDLRVNVMLMESEIDLDATANHDACEQGHCVGYIRERAGLRLSLFWTL